MRPQMELWTRRACAGAVALGITSTTVATAALGASASAGAPVSLAAHLISSRAVPYGARVVVIGRLGTAQAGAPLALQYEPFGSSTWRVLAHGAADRRGNYRLGGRLARSGSLRVISGAATAATATQPVAVSPTLPVQVRAGLRVGRRTLDVLAGQATRVAGTVYPAVPGSQVSLQMRRGGGWSTVARARTGRQGRYRLSYTPHQTGSTIARISFGGSRANAPVQRVLGRVNSYVAVPASWYGPGGTTACGQQLTAGMLGVANKTLPCGTMVTLRYGGHSVRVPVIDRGPYVGNRVFDLTEATKNAIGFDGTGIVWATAS